MYFSKKISKKLGLLLVLLMTVTLLLPAINANAAGAAGSPANNAAQFLHNDYTNNGLKNSEAGVGSYALYVLNQAGVDVSAWANNGINLKDAVISAVTGDIANASDPSKVSAKLLAQDLAAMKALGRNDLADQLMQTLKNRQTAAGFDAGDYSLFSNVPAFDLLGRSGSIGAINNDYAKSYILGTQDTTVSDAAYGSWGYTYSGAYYADFMATAGAVRALYLLDPGKSNAQIQSAVNGGLDWMKKQQQTDGSFVAGMDDPVIDTSEVIVTLKTLGMDPSAWESGGGKSAVDYIMNNAPNADGSFGTSKNDMDATWALCAYNLLDTQFYLDPSSVTLNINDKKQLKAVWQNASGTTDVTQFADWSVADSSIAGTDSSVKGLVTALKAGQTVVSAVYGGLTASTALTVNSSSGGSGGETKTVGQAVVGMNGELLSGPTYVTISETNKLGFTVLGALDCSGVPYHTSTWSYGVLVDSINGQANSGMAGWMFSVNGQIASAGPENSNIKDGDKIIWYYSKSMDQQPPSWNDLVNGNTNGQSANLPTPVNDTAFNTALKNVGSAGQVALQADNTQTSLVLSSDQLTKIVNTGKPLAVTIQGVQLVLSGDSLKVTELTAANTAQLHLIAQKLSSGDARSLIEPFAAKLKQAGDIYELNVLAINKDASLQSIKQFPDCKVLLPVPGEAREAAASGRVAAYWYNENSKNWEKVGGAYDAISGAISFKAEHFSKYALLETVSTPVVKTLPEGKTFKDIKGHWAQKEIEFMAAKGCVSGVGDNKFAPEATVTRAEFAAILGRMAGLTASPGGAERFSDVPAGAWYRGVVGAAANAGLVSGTGENSFAPEEPVTREQMAAMTLRLMAKNGLNMTISDADVAKLLAGFSDAAGISPWARSSVAMMVRERLMAGRERGRFVPLGNATRAEATVVLYLVLQKLPQLGK